MSTCSQRSPRISPRRAPVNRSNRIAATMNVVSVPPRSAVANTSPSRASSVSERKRSNFRSANRLTPRTGLSARSLRLTAKVNIPPSNPTVREAAPLPPFTIARPCGQVFTSAAVFPAATSCMNRSTSARVTACSLFRPRSGFIYPSMRPRSDASVDGFLVAQPSAR